MSDVIKTKVPTVTFTKGKKCLLVASVHDLLARGEVVLLGRKCCLMSFISLLGKRFLLF